ncbi:MAG TPA: hypothetical protein VKU00_26645 [Chthonomonadaceae bacterium]|nr:hypothetical protein [Chthonomonadaceae bacterium]
MEYQIVLSPGLELSATDFVAAWNSTPEGQAVAKASVGESTPTQYVEPSLLVTGIALLHDVSVGIAAAGLYDLIKKICIERGAHKQPQIIEVEQPDGSHLLIITRDEE